MSAKKKTCDFRFKFPLNFNWNFPFRRISYEQLLLEGTSVYVRLNPVSTKHLYNIYATLDALYKCYTNVLCLLGMFNKVIICVNIIYDWWEYAKRDLYNEIFYFHFYLVTGSEGSRSDHFTRIPGLAVSWNKIKEIVSYTWIQHILILY